MDTVFISARSLGNINVHVLNGKARWRWSYRYSWCSIKDTSLEEAYKKVKDIIDTIFKGGRINESYIIKRCKRNR